MVYVLDIHGKPLMPTERHGWVRRMRRAGKAHVVKSEPFTIQLDFETESNTQPVSLGIDAGTSHIGVSATTAEKELYAAEQEQRTNIPELLASRSEKRGERRSRLRYRAPRFDNRRRPEKWLPPSIREKVDAHLNIITDVLSILPITEIHIEVAQFDAQKMKNDAISGEEYQQGDQLGFWNVREYVLARDGHKCQHCKGKSKDPILNVHHIESRKTGGNSPGNLITLCETCHKLYHQGKIELNVRRSTSLRDAAVMNSMRWAVYEKAEELPCKVSYTFGYKTKHTRISAGIAKDHATDARCISGNPQAVPLDHYFHQKRVRRHNRQIFKSNPLKGGRWKPNQAPYLVKGFRLFDKVKYNGRECFIYGRRSSGSFDIRLLDSGKVHAGINCKKLKFMETRQTVLTIKEPRISSHP